MHIDPIDLNYHAVVYSGCSHKRAIQFDYTPLVQRLFRMGYVDFGVQRFALAGIFPFVMLPKSDYKLPIFSCNIEMLTINHELDYFTFYSLN